MTIGKKIEIKEDEKNAAEQLQLCDIFENSEKSLLGQIGIDIIEYNSLLDDYNVTKNQRVRAWISNELNRLHFNVEQNRVKLIVLRENMRKYGDDYDEI